MKGYQQKRSEADTGGFHETQYKRTRGAKIKTKRNKLKKVHGTNFASTYTTSPKILTYVNKFCDNTDIGAGFTLVNGESNEVQQSRM